MVSLLGDVFSGHLANEREGPSSPPNSWPSRHRADDEISLMSTASRIEAGRGAAIALHGYLEVAAQCRELSADQ